MSLLSITFGIIACAVFFLSQIQGGELQIFCAKVEKKFIVHYNILRYGGTEIQQTLIGEQPIQVDL